MMGFGFTLTFINPGWSCSSEHILLSAVYFRTRLLVNSKSGQRVSSSAHPQNLCWVQLPPATGADGPDDPQHEATGEQGRFQLPETVSTTQPHCQEKSHYLKMTKRHNNASLMWFHQRFSGVRWWCRCSRQTSSVRGWDAKLLETTSKAACR